MPKGKKKFDVIDDRVIDNQVRIQILDSAKRPEKKYIISYDGETNFRIKKIYIGSEATNFVPTEYSYEYACATTVNLLNRVFETDKFEYHTK